MTATPFVSPSPARTGVILFGHGSRDPQWRAPIEAVAATIRVRRPDTLVSCAYLELCAPTLAEAALVLIEGGCRTMRVFPLFFGGRQTCTGGPALAG